MLVTRTNVAEASEVALEDNDHKADAVSADKDLLSAANLKQHAVAASRLCYIGTPRPGY